MGGLSLKCLLDTQRRTPVGGENATLASLEFVAPGWTGWVRRGQGEAGQWGWDMRLGGNRCREKADQGGVQGGQGGGRINSVQSRRRVEEDETEPLTMTLACGSLLGAGGR